MRSAASLRMTIAYHDQLPVEPQVDVIVEFQ